MLKQRLLTAAVLIPVVLIVIWFAPMPLLYAVFSAVALLAAWEWTRLMGVEAGSAMRAAYVLISALILFGLWFARVGWPWLALVALLWWCLVFVWVCRYPGIFSVHQPAIGSLAIAGQLLWPPGVLALVMLRAQPNGAEKLIFALALVWAADTGAYFAGRAFGRAKLAPQVSPGKTWAGALGGLALALVWSVIGGLVAFELGWTPHLAGFCALGVFAGAVSVVGDLGVSMFKRLSGVKDSGSILPGHGGILDRVDSLFAAAPVLIFGLWLFGFWSR